MKSIRARLVAILAGAIIGALASWGVGDLGGGGAARVEAWVNHTFELVLFVAYAVVHPWLQKRWNPTGAFTGEAARKLERVAHVEPRP